MVVKGITNLGSGFNRSYHWQDHDHGCYCHNVIIESRELSSSSSWFWLEKVSVLAEHGEVAKDHPRGWLPALLKHTYTSDDDDEEEEEEEEDSLIRGNEPPPQLSKLVRWSKFLFQDWARSLNLPGIEECQRCRSQVSWSKRTGA